MRIGLIGEKLGHSFSKPIHEALADYTYELIPLAKDEFAPFMEQRNFQAINVTLPYKEDVIPYCDVVDERARAIGAVNTIVQREGKLFGYNTDFDGFLYMAERHGIDFSNKKILILGTGGTRKTITAVAKSRGVREILVASRSAKEGTISYEQCKEHPDVDIIINASPQGMYPNNGTCLIDLANFPQCTAVMDVVYNPLKTALLLQAEQRDIQAINGLEMLVAQAKYAAEYFVGRSIAQGQIDRIYQSLRMDLSNIVLIGMPSAGKTTLGRRLSKLLGKTFVDADEMLVSEQKQSIPEIFARGGETLFREMEADVIARIGKQTGQVVATGGGVIKRESNMQALRQNGLIIFLDRDCKRLMTDPNRPLSSSPAAIEQMERERRPLYKAYSDLHVQNNGNPKQTLMEMEKQIHAYFGH